MQPWTVHAFHVRQCIESWFIAHLEIEMRGDRSIDRPNERAHTQTKLKHSNDPSIIYVVHFIRANYLIHAISNEIRKCFGAGATKTLGREPVDT